jgi:hypothetical protein
MSRRKRRERIQAWAPAIGAAVIVRGAFPGRPEGQCDRMGTVISRCVLLRALRLEANGSHKLL